MVAIVNGSGLGLMETRRLGSAGMIGSAASGMMGDGLFVNAANGNLIVQSQQDGFVSGRGVGIGVVRTYNSYAHFDGDNNDRWKIGFYRQVHGLRGTANTAGSKIFRTDGDGNEQEFDFDTARGVYVSAVGGETDDTLAFDSVAGRWTWTDGNTQVQETYDWNRTAGQGRLTGLQDPDGNTQAYVYDGSGLLNHVTLANGDSVYLDYTGTNLRTIRIVDAANNLLESTHYEYDELNRLSNVAKEWQEDGVARKYSLQYKYEDASNRLSSIEESDPSANQSLLAKLAFTYRLHSDGNYRVETITDMRLGRVTHLEYDLAARKTTITDPLSGVTELTHDADGNLVDAEFPAVGGSRTHLHYEYYADGRLHRIVDAQRAATVYGYDARGNRNSESYPNGVSITRLFDDQNRLVRETLQGGVDNPLGERKTYYAYDRAGNLRFEVSAIGEVTEHRYDGWGQRVATLRIGREFYPVDSILGVPTEETLAAWTATRTNFKLQRTDYTYDFRGQLESATTYSATKTDGTGDATKPKTVTTYVHDYAGRLLGSTDSNRFTTAYTYDGMGRLLTSREGDLVKTRLYADAGHSVLTTVVTAQADGLQTLQQFNAAGELISVTQGGRASTTFAYDQNGNLRLTTDSTGIKTMALYDSARRKIAEIGNDGRMVVFQYNSNHQLVRTVRYANALTATQLADLQSTENGTAPLFDAIDDLTPWLPIPNSDDDRAEWSLYDAVGQLMKTIDATGHVTEFKRGPDGNVLASIRYAVALTATELGALTLESTADDVPTTYTQYARVERSVYDKAGKLRAAVDGEGYITEYTYDAGGLLTKTSRYYERLNDLSNPDFSLDLSIIPTGRPSDPAPALRTYYRYDARGLLTSEVDAEEYLTEFEYDDAGNKTRVTRYAGRITGASAEFGTIEQLRARAIENGLPEQPQVVAYTYNALGLVESQTSADGVLTTYGYDEHGRLIRQTAAQGTTEELIQTWKYDKYGQLEKQFNAEGKFASYQYDDAGRMTQSVDYKGNVTWYYYDDAGILTHTINSLGEVRTQLHNNFLETRQESTHVNRLSDTVVGSLQGGFVDAALRTAISQLFDAQKDGVVEYKYTRRGELKERSDNSGALTTYRYNAFGEVDRQQVLDGATTIHDYDRRGLLKFTSADRDIYRQYDAFGRLVLVDDGTETINFFHYDNLGRNVYLIGAENWRNGSSAGVVMAYDAFGRMTSRTDAMGNTTTYQYDAAERKTVMISAGGISVTTFYNRHGEVREIVDGRGNTTTYQYNKNLQLTKVLDGDGNILESREYDDNGNQTLATDGSGRKISYRYDAANRLFKTIVDPDGLNQVTETTFDGRGQAITIKDANGVVTTQTFYQNGKLKDFIVDPDGLALRTVFTYDAAGNVMSMTEGAGSATPRTTSYVYDDFGRRLSETIDPEGLALTTTYDYDRYGNVVRKTDANGHVTLYGYDADHRMVLTIEATGVATSYRYDYDGRLVETTVHAASAEEYLSWPVEELQGMHWADFVELPPDNNDRATTNVYDADGRIKFVIGPNRQVTGYVRDNNGNVVVTRQYAATDWTLIGNNLVIAESPQDRLRQNVYDEFNRVRFEIDAEGRVIESRFDEDGRIEAKIAYLCTVMPTGAERTVASMQAELTSSASDRTTSFSYDGAGRVSSTTDPQGHVVTYAYDAVGRQAGVTQQAGTSASDPDNRTVRTVFDAAGRQAYVIDAQGFVTEFVHNAVGEGVRTIRHAERIAVPSGTLTVAVIAGLLSQDATDRTEVNQYNAAGLMTMHIDALGRTTMYEYDAGGQLTLTRQCAELAEWNEAGHTWIAPSTSAGDRRTAIVRDVLNQVSYIVDAEGRVTYQHVNNFGQVDVTTQFAAKVTGWATGAEAGDALSLASLAELANAATDRTSYVVYNNNGQVSYTIDPMGRVTGVQHNVFGDETITTAYANPGQWVDGEFQVADSDSDRRTASVMDLEHRRRFTVDAEGRVTMLTLDSFGGVTSSTQLAATVAGWATRDEAADALDPANLAALANASRDRTTEMVYNANGEVIYTRDPMGHVTGIQRNAFGEVTITTAYVNPGQWVDGEFQVADSDNDRRTASITDLEHNRRFTVDAEGHITMLALDSFGGVTSSTQVFLTVTGWKTRDEAADALDPANLALRLYPYHDRTTEMVYNANGEVIYTRDPLGHVTGVQRNAFGDVTITTAYANPGQWVDGEFQVADSDGDRRTASIVDLEHGRRFTVDAEGRVTMLTLDSFGGVTSSTQLAATVAGWATRDEAADALDPANLAALANASRDRTAETVYNANGEVIYTRDPMGHVTGIQRNAFGEVTITTAYVNPGQWVGGEFQVQESPDDHRTASIKDLEHHRQFNVDGEGRVTMLTFDSFGGVVSSTELATIVTGWTTRTEAADALDPSDLAELADAARDRTTQMVYNKNGHVIYSIAPMGNVVGMQYNAFDEVIGKTAFVNAGQWIGGEFQVAGHAGDRHTAMAYNANGQVVAEVDALGAVTTHLFDTFGKLSHTFRYGEAIQNWSASSVFTGELPNNVAASHIRHSGFAYDKNGNMTVAVDEKGAVTIHTYNAFDELTDTRRYARVVEGWISGWTPGAIFTGELPSYVTSGSARHTQNVYGSGGQITHRIDAAGTVTKFDFDDFGNVKRTSTFAAQITTRSPADALATALAGLEGTEARIANSVRNANNQVVYDIDQTGHVTKFDHDEFGRVVRMTSFAEPIAVDLSDADLATALAQLDPTRARITSRAYNANGELTHEVDAMGNVTKYEYDAFGKTVRTKRFEQTIAVGLSGPDLDAALTALENTEARIKAFVYDANGQPVWQVNELGHVAKLDYNRFGQVTRATSFEATVAVGLSDAALATALSELSPANARATVTAYDAGGRVIGTVAVTGHVTTYRYNAYGDKLGTFRYGTAITGWSATSVFDGTLPGNVAGGDCRHSAAFHDDGGFVIASVDEAGYVKSYERNAYGELIRVVEYETAIQYWGPSSYFIGPPPYVAEGPSRETVMTYNERGQQVRTMDAAMRVSETVYNAYGDVSQKIRYSQPGTWDGTNKTIAVAPSAQDRVAEFFYDAHGRLTQEVGADGATTVVTYGSYGEVSQKIARYNKAHWNAASKHWELRAADEQRDRVTQFAYNAVGQVTTQVGPDGRTAVSVYGAFNELRLAIARFTLAEWDPDNHVWLLPEQDGEDRVRQFSYDAAGRVTEEIDPEGKTVATVYTNFGEVKQRIVRFENAVFNGDAVGWESPDPSENDRITEQMYNVYGQAVFTVDAANRVTQTLYGAYGETRGQVQYATPLGDDAPRTEQGVAAFYSANGGNRNAAEDRYTAQIIGQNGRVAFSVDAQGYLTRYEYDFQGAVTGVQRYANAIANWSQDVTLPANPVSLVTVDPAEDSFTATAYDAAGHARFRVDAEGNVTELRYSPFDEVVAEIRYATPIGTPENPWGPSRAHDLAALEEWAETHAATADRYSATVYAKNGVALYTVDAKGHVVEYAQNNFGEITLTKRYWNSVTNWPQSPQLPESAGELVQSGRLQVNVSLDRWTFTVRDASGRECFEYDAENYVTEKVYNTFGEVREVLRYQEELYAAVNVNTTVAEMAVHRYALTHDYNGNEVLPASTRYAYNRAGQVTDITRRIDATQSVVTHTAYDTFGQAVEVTDAYGTAQAVTSKREFDKLGRVTAETQAYGTADEVTTRYHYGFNSTEVTSTRGIDLLERDTDWARSERIALLGAAKEYKSSLTDADKAVLRALYTTVQKTDRSGRVVEIAAPAVKTAAGAEQLVKKQVYVGNTVTTKSYLRSVSSAGVVTESYLAGYDEYVEYDRLGRESVYVDAVQQKTVKQYNAFGELETLAKHARSGLTGVSDETTTFAYDKMGRRIDTLTQFGSAADVRHEAASYNAFGEQQTKDVYWNNSDGAKIGHWTYEYDRLGRLHIETLPVTAKNASGQDAPVRKVYNYDANGNLTSLSEAGSQPEGRLTFFKYDLAGRMTSKTDPTVAAYDPDTGAVSNYARTEHYVYDLRGNRIKTVLDDLASGRVLARTYYNLRNQLTDDINAGGTLTSRTLDAAGNTWKLSVYGAAVTLNADGSLPPPANRPAEHRDSEFRYDAANHMIEVKVRDVMVGEYREDLAGGPGYVTFKANVVNRSVYDVHGNLVKAVDARGGETRYFYDAGKRKVGELSTGGYLTTWDYHVEQGTGARIVEARYGNASNGGAGITAADGESFLTVRTRAYVASFNTEGGYIPADLMPEEDVQPHQMRITTRYVDAEGKVKQERVHLGGTLQQPTAATTTYTYNALGQISMVEDADQFVTTFDYDALGRQTRKRVNLTKAVAASGTYTIDPNATDWGVEGNAQWQISETEYNGLGQVSREIRHGITDDKDRITKYVYNKLGKLIKLTDGLNKDTTYDYDKDGNQVRMSRVVRRADNTTALESTVSKYDAMGRTTRTWHEVNGQNEDGTVQAMRYNLYGDMIEKGRFKPSDGEPTNLQEYMEYNALGQMVKTNSDGVVKFFVYDQNGNVSMTVQSSGSNDLRGRTLADLAGLAGSNWFHGGVSLTMTAYDAENRAIKTLQPNTGLQGIMGELASQIRAYDNGSQGAAMEVNRSTGSSGTVLNVVANGQPVGVGGPGGTLNYTVTSERYRRYDQYGTPYTVVKDRLLSLTLSSAAIVDTGIATQYEVELVDNHGQRIALAVGGVNDTFTLEFAEKTIVGGQLRIYRRINPGENGRELLGGKVYNTASPPQPYPPLTGPEYWDATVTTNDSLQTPAVGPKLRIVGMPGDTFKTIIGYRRKNMPGTAFTYQTMAQVGAGGSLVRPDAFNLDLGGGNFFAGEDYEYQYMAVDKNGLLVASGGGTFQLEGSQYWMSGRVLLGPEFNMATPAVHVGGGAAVIDIGNGPRTVVFFDQARTSIESSPSRPTASLRYRDANGVWQTETLSAAPAIAGATIQGSYVWSLPAGTYLSDYVLTVTDANGQVLSQSAGQVQLDNVSRVVSYGRLQDRTQAVRITALPAGTKQIQVSYRVHGSTGSYTTAVTALSAGENGVFVWDALGLPEGIYDYRVEALDANGATLRTTVGEIRLGINGAQLSRNVEGPSVGVTDPVNMTQSYWKLSGLDRLTYKTEIEYNAFGQVVNQKDARGNVTTFAYDGAGRMTRQLAAQERYMDGVTQGDAFRAETQYQYSAGGRMVKKTDAAGNRMYYTYLNLRDESGNNVSTIEYSGDPQTWIYNLTRYNLFGQALASKDRGNNETIKEYNNKGEMTRLLKRAPGAVPEDPYHAASDRTDYRYEYDENGRRIKETNVSDANYSLSRSSRTFYYVDGRIKETRSAENVKTLYTYVYNKDITGAGGAVVGGYQQLTSVVGMPTLSWSLVNHFGQTVMSHNGTDLAEMGFDFAGHLVTQQNSAGQSITHIYNINGQLASTIDGVANRRMDYAYDGNGNKIVEQVSTVGYINVPSRVLDATKMRYNAQNWMTDMSSGDTVVHHDYDRLGNIRHTGTVFNHAFDASGTRKTQDNWYAYDELKRVTISKGTVVNGEVVRGDRGIQIGYDYAGNRQSVSYGAQASENTTGNVRNEVYTTRFSDGEITSINVNNGAETSSRTLVYDHGRAVWHQSEARNDQQGVVYKVLTTKYNWDHQVFNETVELSMSDDRYSTREITRNYMADGKTVQSETETSHEHTPLNDDVFDRRWREQTTSTTTTYTYEYRGAPQVKSATTSGQVTAVTYIEHDDGSREDEGPPVTVANVDGYTLNQYDGNGNLRSSSSHNTTLGTSGGSNAVGRWTEVRYQNDVNGAVVSQSQIVRARRDQNSAPVVEHHYVQNVIANGRTIGTLSNDPLQKNYEVARVPTDPNAAPEPWQAKEVNDFDQTYVSISEQLRLGGSIGYTASEGETLQMVAARLYGDASLWYKLADANGMSGTERLRGGQMLNAPALAGGIHKLASTGRSSAVRPGSGLLQGIAAAMPVDMAKECGMLGRLAVLGITAIVAGALTVATGGAGGVAGAMMIGFASNLVGQAVGAAAGWTKFDPAAVVIGTLTPGVGGAVGAAAGKIVGDVAANALGQFVTQSISGALVGGGSRILQDAMAGRSIQWDKVAKEALIGGVMGGVSSLMNSASEQVISGMRSHTAAQTVALQKVATIASSGVRSFGKALLRDELYSRIMPDERTGEGISAFERFAGMAIRATGDMVDTAVQISAGERRAREIEALQRHLRSMPAHLRPTLMTGSMSLEQQAEEWTRNAATSDGWTPADRQGPLFASWDNGNQSETATDAGSGSDAGYQEGLPEFPGENRTVVRAKRPTPEEAARARREYELARLRQESQGDEAEHAYGQLPAAGDVAGADEPQPRGTPARRLVSALTTELPKVADNSWMSYYRQEAAADQRVRNLKPTTSYVDRGPNVSVMPRSNNPSSPQVYGMPAEFMGAAGNMSPEHLRAWADLAPQDWNTGKATLTPLMELQQPFVDSRHFRATTEGLGRVGTDLVVEKLPAGVPAETRIYPDGKAVIAVDPSASRDAVLHEVRHQHTGKDLQHMGFAGEGTRPLEEADAYGQQARRLEKYAKLEGANVDAQLKQIEAHIASEGFNETYKQSLAQTAPDALREYVSKNMPLVKSAFGTSPQSTGTWPTTVPSANGGPIVRHVKTVTWPTVILKNNQVWSPGHIQWQFEPEEIKLAKELWDINLSEAYGQHPLPGARPKDLVVEGRTETNKPFSITAKVVEAAPYAQDPRVPRVWATQYPGDPLPVTKSALIFDHGHVDWAAARVFESHATYFNPTYITAGPAKANCVWGHIDMLNQLGLADFRNLDANTTPQELHQKIAEANLRFDNPLLRRTKPLAPVVGTKPSAVPQASATPPIMASHIEEPSASSRAIPQQSSLEADRKFAENFFGYVPPGSAESKGPWFYGEAGTRWDYKPTPRMVNAGSSVGTGAKGAGWLMVGYAVYNDAGRLGTAFGEAEMQNDNSPIFYTSARIARDWTVGWGGAVAGGWAGAAAGGAVGGPFAPVTAPIGGVVGAVSGGYAAVTGTDTLGDKLIEVGEVAAEYQRQNSQPVPSHYTGRTYNSPLEFIFGRRR
ncbi:MAG TPA: hypothetical protein VEC06_08865 [Paucimonas sp.]|nr:hypothetical protein [Paucimonas sp.]